MKSRLLTVALVCLFGLGSAVLAQAPKSGDKGGEKKAPAPKTPADLAFDEFNKIRTEQGGKMDQARFTRLINAGIIYLTQYPTHGRVNEAVRELAFFGLAIDSKQPALRTSYSSNLKLEVTNMKYKEGVTDPAKAVLAALDASVADFDARTAYSGDNLTALREKIDALAETPGGARFLVDRERSYAHIAIVNGAAGRAEMHLKKLLEHKEKPVVAMAQEELNIIEARKAPNAMKVTTVDGKEVDLAQLRGKVVGIYFWSSAHKGSVDRIEALKQLSSTYKKRGFEVVTVSYDKEEDKAKLEKAIKDTRVAWPVGFDGKGAKGEFGTKLNATGVPRFYLLDQKGILQVALSEERVARVTPDIPSRQIEGKIKQLLNIK
jgi:alkyl hydroperoxide reductase subunit AhpC